MCRRLRLTLLDLWLQQVISLQCQVRQMAAAYRVQERSYAGAKIQVFSVHLTLVLLLDANPKPGAQPLPALVAHSHSSFC